MVNLHSLNTTEVEFKATSSPYPIAFRIDMKYYTVLYEQQRHRTRTSCSHPSNNVPQRLAERVWWTKSQSSLLNIYFRFSGFQPLLLSIHFRYGPSTCSHCAKVWHRTSPICDAQVSRAAQRSFALLQKSRRNHRSYVWTEALSSMVFVTAQKQSGIVQT